MTTKKPNFIIKFDNSNPTQAEKDQAFLGLFNCLAKIAIRIESVKEGTIKEQKEIEQNPNIEICAKLRQNGLILIPAGANALRFLPPLNITASDIDKAVKILDKTLEKL